MVSLLPKLCFSLFLSQPLSSEIRIQFLPHPRMGISIFCIKIFIFTHIFAYSEEVGLFLLEPLSQKSGNLEQIGQET